MKNIPKLAEIHHYCDNWCDRCSLRLKCQIFQFEVRERVNDLVAERQEAKTLVSSAFNQTGELEDVLPSLPALEKIELPEPDTDQEESREIWKKYVSLFFQLSRVKGDEIDEVSGFLEYGNDEVGSHSYHWERIQQYVFILGVKIADALTISPIDADSIDAIHPIGAAKTAIEIIDDSIESWNSLFTLGIDLTHFQGELIENLEQIRFSLEQEFPSSACFHRPGLD